ncbi:MAG: dihydrofolate reductase [Candidatus Saccharibacteria bacterium]|nr:dihydrofolate reductase [Candidatus Saccharibacteria bacterium]
MKSIIVAYDKNRGIGAANDLLWLRDLPADLRHFRELTTGSTVIMGRNTFQSIGRPLANRHNIVISRQQEAIDGVTVVESIEQAYEAAPTSDVFVIGGGQIYTLALSTVDRIYATEVDEVFSAADIFFPTINDDEWHEVSREKHTKDEANKYDYSFVMFDRNT